MTKANLQFSIIFFAGLFATLVCSAQEYQEVGYDDLVRQISARKRNLEANRQPNLFEQVKIHAGFGYVNSFSQMEIQNRSTQRYQNGIQLSLGVDLFSDNWFAETSFRNFGITKYGSEENLLKEFDLKFGFKDQIKRPVVYRLEGGLANRYLRVTDSVTGTDIDDTTPMIMGSVGVSAQINPFISVGLDVSGKSSIISHTADKSAIDFAFAVRGTL